MGKKVSRIEDWEAELECYAENIVTAVPRHEVPRTENTEWATVERMLDFQKQLRGLLS